MAIPCDLSNMRPSTNFFSVNEIFYIMQIGTIATTPEFITSPEAGIRRGLHQAI
jgi:hypothetical protein